MSNEMEFEEEEFSTQFNGQTVLRILGQLKPYWVWVLGFLAATGVVASTDAYFTYLSKRIIDALFRPCRHPIWRRVLILRCRMLYGLKPTTFRPC